MRVFVVISLFFSFLSSSVFSAEEEGSTTEEMKKKIISMGGESLIRMVEQADTEEARQEIWEALQASKAERLARQAKEQAERQAEEEEEARKDEERKKKDRENSERLAKEIEEINEATAVEEKLKDLLPGYFSPTLWVPDMSLLYELHSKAKQFDLEAEEEFQKHKRKRQEVIDAIWICKRKQVDEEYSLRDAIKEDENRVEKNMSLHAWLESQLKE